MTWASPEAFVLLALPVLWWVWRWLKPSRERPSLSWTPPAGFRPRTSWRWMLSYIAPGLLVLGWVFFVVALARPQKSDSKVKKNVEGIDILIALDTSDSMAIEDMKPTNRMESAKSIIEGFIRTRASDRMGLLVFSGEAYTRVPLTLDYPLLIKSLREVKSSRSMKMGTAIGVALAAAVARLRDSTAKSRVVVLLTDGENNSGTIDPETALEIAKGYGIRIYAIGVGQDGMAQLPVWTKDAFGNQVKRYQPMHSAVNDDLLGRMSQETGGRYFRAIDTAALRRTFDTIGSLEKSKIETQQYTKYTELYAYPLQAGAGLWCLAFALLALGFWRRP